MASQEEYEGRVRRVDSLLLQKRREEKGKKKLKKALSAQQCHSRGWGHPLFQRISRAMRGRASVDRRVHMYTRL